MVRKVNKKTNWALSLIGGGRPLKRGGLYSFDNKYYILPFNNQLKVYYIATRQCVRSIADMSFESLVDLRVDPSQAGLVWFFKASGEVMAVNWKDRSLKGTSAVVYQNKLEGLENLNMIVDFRFNFSLNSYEILGLVGKTPHKPTSSSAHKRTLVKVVLKMDTGSRFEGSSVETTELLALKNVVLYTKSLNSKLLVFLSEHSNLHKAKKPLLDLTIVELKSFNVHDQHSMVLKKDIRITSLAVSNSNIVAVGLSSGAVELLYNFVGSSKKQLQQHQFISNNSKVLKWHINPVSALGFTKDGNYLLSGGKERVLVFWHLESDKLQFLPRLNGDISSISTNFFSPDINSTVSAANKNDGIDYYTVVLDVPNSQNHEIEYLVLNSTELTSRLSISSLRLNTRYPLALLHKERKRVAKEMANKDSSPIHRIEKDYTVEVEINSIDKNLYLANGSDIQNFHLVRNEQFYSLSVVPKISIGKVKSELTLKDPRVDQFKFTHDGNWMVTFDEYETPSVDNVLSKGLMSYNLKFWKLSNTTSSAGNDDTKNNQWELTTKIVDPHGPGVKIVAIKVAPMSYFNGVAVITVDNKGGVRLWRPQQPKLSYNVVKANKTQPTAWTLRKFISSLTNKEADTVCVDWSSDATLILVSLNNIIYTVPVTNFDNWSYLDTQKLLVNSKAIKQIKLINNDLHLVVLTEEFLLNYDLINDKPVYQYKLDSTKSAFSEKLIAFHETHFVVALNLFVGKSTKDKNTTVQAHSMVLIFDYLQTKPLHLLNYNYYITALKEIPGTLNFLFIDNNYNIGVITSSLYIDSDAVSALPAAAVPSLLASGDALAVEKGPGFMEEMVSLVQTSQTLKLNGSIDKDGDISMGDIDQQDDQFWYGKRINNHTFDTVLSRDLDGLDMEDLFDAIMDCI